MMDASLTVNTNSPEQIDGLVYNDLVQSMSDVKMWKGIDASGEYNGGKGMLTFAIISILIIVIVAIIIWKVVL